MSEIALIVEDTNYFKEFFKNDKNVVIFENTLVKHRQTYGLGEIYREAQNGIDLAPREKFSMIISIHNGIVPIGPEFIYIEVMITKNLISGEETYITSQGIPVSRSAVCESIFEKKQKVKVSELIKIEKKSRLLPLNFPFLKQ